jgi:hypothetical protein
MFISAKATPTSPNVFRNYSLSVVTNKFKQKIKVSFYDITTTFLLFTYELVKVHRLIFSEQLIIYISNTAIY